MKKLKFNSTLNHKQSDYKPYEVEVEKVITLYGRQFEEMKNHTLNDNPWIDENRDIMYIDDNHTAHCLLFIDNETGDGILVEAEGCGYARKSQFIPNARALLESNELTAAEIKLHERLKDIAGKIAELAHCGEKYFVFEDLMERVDLDVNDIMRDAVTAMLRKREDIKMAENTFIADSCQPDIKVEALPVQKLTFYCPLHIVKQCDESDFDFDEEIIEDFEHIPSKYATSCIDEINDFIRDYAEPNEEHRGLMVYYDDNPVVAEKVFSAFPSVKEINGELVGVFECKVAGSLTDSELNELREYLTGQASDGWGEGLEQREIKTADYGEVYVSFWNSSDNWSMQTDEEMKFEQSEDLSEEMNMSM